VLTIYKTNSPQLCRSSEKRLRRLIEEEKFLIHKKLSRALGNL